MNGSIVSIWLKRMKHGPMDRVMFAELVAGRGLRGNADQGGKRQITIMTEAAWDAAQEALGIALDPSLRRANLLVRGVDLENSRGKHLRLGNCVVRIYGETRPCRKLEEMQPGLRAALDPHWRGGVFAEIIEGGVIRIGDDASFAAD